MGDPEIAAVLSVRKGGQKADPEQMEKAVVFIKANPNITVKQLIAGDRRLGSTASEIGGQTGGLRRVAVAQAYAPSDAPLREENHHHHTVTHIGGGRNKFLSPPLCVLWRKQPSERKPMSANLHLELSFETGEIVSLIARIYVKTWSGLVEGDPAQYLTQDCADARDLNIAIPALAARLASGRASGAVSGGRGGGAGPERDLRFV